MSESRTKGIVAVGIAVCVVAAVAHALWFWPTVIDDAYITFRYALSWVSGGGLSFNPGERPVEGFSSPIWMALTALALKLGARDVLLVAKLVGLLLHALTTVLVWHLAADAGERRRLSSLLAPLAWAVQPYAAYHAVTGMETSVAGVLLAIAVLSLLDARRHPRRAAVGLAGSLITLIVSRPEGFGYAALLLVAGLVAHRGDRDARRAVLLAAGAWLLAFALLVAWRESVFHALVPNTVAAKVPGLGGLARWMKGARYVAPFFASPKLPADAAALLLTALVLLRPPRGRALLLVVPIVGAMAFAIEVGGDWMQSFRFLVPATPFVCALVGRAGLRLEQSWPWRVPLARLAVAVVMAVFGAFLAQDAMLGLVRVDEFGAYHRSWKPLRWPLQLPARIHEGFEMRLAGVSRWTLERLPEGAMLATGDIGFPAWVSQARVLDLLGLTDATVARAMAYEGPVAYARYIRSRRPDVVVLRMEHGHPSASYDALVASSGVLEGLVPSDTVATYGEDAMAVMYRRAGSSSPTPEQVLARYARARRWNPRVLELARFEAAYRAAHPGVVAAP